MKKTYEELCTALEGEEIELNVKLEHLEHFMMSEEFQEISERQKELLTRQLEAMRMYKGALIARVMQARFEHTKPGVTCAPEPEKEERIEPHVVDAIRYKLDRKKKAKEEESVEGNYCSTCRYGAECPDGPRCKKCDNGSKWMGPKETKRECAKCKHYDRGACINPHHCLFASEWEAK